MLWWPVGGAQLQGGFRYHVQPGRAQGLTTWHVLFSALNLQGWLVWQELIVNIFSLQDECDHITTWLLFRPVLWFCEFKLESLQWNFTLPATAANWHLFNMAGAKSTGWTIITSTCNGLSYLSVKRLQRGLYIYRRGSAGWFKKLADLLAAPAGAEHSHISALWLKGDSKGPFLWQKANTKENLHSDTFPFDKVPWIQ